MLEFAAAAPLPRCHSESLSAGRSSTIEVLDEAVLTDAARDAADPLLFVAEIARLFRREVSRHAKQAVLQSVKGNSLAVELAAHALYTAAEGVGARRLAARCLRLENTARTFRGEELRRMAVRVFEEAVTADLSLRGLADRWRRDAVPLPAGPRAGGPAGDQAGTGGASM